MQQLARMGVRETIEASAKERWTVKSLLAVSDAIRTVREVLGTKASKEAGAITDRIQENLDAAIKARGGEAPAATSKAEKSEIADEAGKLMAMPADAFNSDIRTRKGGLTGDAYRLGRAVRTPEDLQAIQDGQAKARAEGQTHKQAGDFDKAIAAAMRGQYFREAYEAATGTGSAGDALRKHEPGYQAPAPEGRFDETPGARRKGGEEQTPEFFLPPVSGAVERLAASELGLLP